MDTPPQGFAERAAVLEDAPAIAELMNEVTLAEVGVPWTTVEEVRDALTAPGQDPALASVVMVEPDGRIVGYASLDPAGEPVQVHALVFVSPRLWGRGLSAHLVRWAEGRAGGLARSLGAPVPVLVSRFVGNDAASRLFDALGYSRVRTFWLMRIDLGDAPPPPRVPEGIEIRAFRPGEDERATYGALAEAFADHWGGGFPTFEAWRHHELDGEGSSFDPGLWFVAVAGDEIVGAVCCRAESPRFEAAAEVSELGVRRAWRRRGIALALLLTALAEIRRRGVSAAGLAVDAESPTGATRLYERAGMTETLSWDVWERRIGP